MHSDPDSERDDGPGLGFPRALADRCVKCGLCLPHCPTYVLHQDEGESPRGRIALMQGLDDGRVSATPALRAHLDSCLACRRCEVVCPAGVPYGQVLDAGRAMLRRQLPQTGRLPGWVRALTVAPLRNSAHALLWLGQRLGLRWLAQHTPLPARWRRLSRYWPGLEQPQRLAARRPGSVAHGRVALFTGCVGRMAGQRALRDSLGVLAALGYAVDVPRAQGCCGALDLHTGDPDRAADCATQNLAAFTSGDYDAVLGCDSACVATLDEYPQGLAERAGATTRLPPVRDICAFVQQHWPDDLQLKPLRARVVLHVPCTQRNVLHSGQATADLLSRIPGVQLSRLDDAGCCGAAGSYWLTQPAAADALIRPKIEELRTSAADYLASSNIGCALHFSAHLQGGCRVIHPISLIYQQLMMARSAH